MAGLRVRLLGGQFGTRISEIFISGFTTFPMFEIGDCRSVGNFFSRKHFVEVARVFH